MKKTTASGLKCVTVTWTPDPSASKKDKYRIKVQRCGDQNYHTVNPYRVKDNKMNVRFLKADTAYKFSVQSYNENGESKYTDKVTAMPGKPENRPPDFCKICNKPRARLKNHLFSKHCREPSLVLLLDRVQQEPPQILEAKRTTS